MIMLVKKKVRKLTQEAFKLKIYQERENIWTNSSIIVNKLSERNHYEKAGLGFYKNINATRDCVTYMETLNVLLLSVS